MKYYKGDALSLPHTCQDGNHAPCSACENEPELLFDDEDPSDKAKMDEFFGYNKEPRAG